MNCQTPIRITTLSTRTPISVRLVQGGQSVELSSATVRAKLNDKHGNEVVAYTETGITKQPQRNLGSIDAEGYINVYAHNLANGWQVRFTSTDTLPTGLAAGDYYFVRDCSPNRFRVAATAGGEPIKPTDGDGDHAITQVGVVYWQLPTGLQPGEYRLWVSVTDSEGVDEFGIPEGVELSVCAS